MRLRNAIAASVTIMSVCCAIALVQPAIGQSGAPTVSVVNLQAMPGQGSTMVVTPRGQVVPLPGAGVNGNVVQIYMGSQGGYWYIDKTGQNVDLTQAVMAYRNAGGGQAAPSQYAPPQYAPAPVNITNENGSGSSGSSAATTAALAGMAGMATGAAITAATQPDYWHGMPYGTPYTYGAGGHAYYGAQNGNNVMYVNNKSKTNNVAVNQNNSVHANNYQNQQQYYQTQVNNKSGNYNSWQQSAGQTNPFTRQEGASAQRQTAAGQYGQGQAQGFSQARAQGTEGGGGFAQSRQQQGQAGGFAQERQQGASSGGGFLSRERNAGGGASGGGFLGREREGAFGGGGGGRRFGR